MTKKEDILRRTEWFRSARFGMFIHWGLYSIPARGEWVRSNERIPEEEYLPYFEEFCPQDYDLRKWAQAAKDAGMKYAVLTAKHHDGFCLFDSSLTDYKSTNTRLGRDIVADFLEAFREEGLRVGLYYSIIDWHHKDYPHYSDSIHPMRGNAAYKRENPDFENYLCYMHGQVEELVTRYGKIDILWTDFSYDDMRGEKWKATELVKMIRRHQPDIILDNRLEVSGEGFGSIMDEEPSDFSGDFVTPEQIIPPAPLKDKAGNAVPWESCVTMNNSWGYRYGDNVFKSSALLIRSLVNCVSKDGNMLLNIGPDARGNIPRESLERLADIGRWMRENGESIYGAGASGLPKPEYGRFTRKGNRLYVHVTEDMIGPVPVAGIKDKKIECIRLLRNGCELKQVSAFTTVNYPELVFIAMGDEPTFTYPMPDAADTVIEITFDEN